MTRAVMSVMKNTPKVWFVFIFFRPDSVTNPKNLSIYSGRLCNGFDGFGVKTRYGVITI